MPNVNYVREHTHFVEYASDERLTSGERLLWYALIHIMNQRAQGRDWPEGFIRIANERLFFYTGLKYDAIAAARNKLKQRGLIDFVPGKGSEKGKDKAQSPLYKVNYFYPEYPEPEIPAPSDADRPEKTDGMGDGLGDGLGGGLGDGLGGGPRYGLGDIYINYTETRQNNPNNTPGEEDDYNTDIQQDGAAPDLFARARNAGEAAYAQYIALWIERNPKVKQTFGAGLSAVRGLMRSGRFPLELAGYALEKTIARNERFGQPLGNPAAYMQTLLEDWENQGFESIRDVEEAKDDWGRMG